MEDWETLLETYSPPRDAKEFSQVLRVAEFTLAKELTGFEEDFILKTLMKKPVSLVYLLKKKNTDPSWSKVISDSMKLLANVVMKFKLSDIYYEMIVELCSLSYDPQTNQQALHCLACVVKRSHYGADNINRYIYALELGTSCKAQLAVYIGAICEFHPDRVADDINTIWRVFLNLFDIGKYSTSVIKAVLQGIQSVLKHFGNELPMMELNMFYDKLVMCFDIERCADVCTSILGEFAGLFRERLRDPRVHAHLWARVGNPLARDALRKMYKEMEMESLQEMIIEMKVNAESDNMHKKLTALSIMKDAQERGVDTAADVGDYMDLAVLEFELRNGTVTYDCADAISWCIEANIYHSDRLLKVALITYDTIPVGKKRQIIHSLLTCPPEIRPEIVEFLIAETCRCPERFMAIWREAFDSKGDTDPVVAQYGPLVLQEFVKAVHFIVENPDINWVDPLPEHSSLLRLVWEVLWWCPSAALAKPLLRCARLQCEAVPAALLACFDSTDQPDINIDRFTSDTALVLCGTALMKAPDVAMFPTGELLKFLQIIFNHNNADASTLTGALQKLEYLLFSGKSLDDRILDDIYARIQKIASRKAEGKDARILRRDAIIFLGKHRRNTGCDVSADVILMTSLKECLFVNVPESNVHMKIHLHKILHLALIDENENAIRTLLCVICHSLSVRKDALLQNALYRVLTGLSRFTLDLDTLKSCLSYCDPTSAVELIRCISQEKSPGSREALLQGLEVLLTGDLDEQVLEEVMEQVLLCDELNQNEADILKLIIKVSTNNNTLIQKYILNIIHKGIKCNAELTTMATEIFVNRIGLFEKQLIHTLINDMFKVIHSFKYNENIKVILNVLMFIKTLIEHTECNKFKIFCDFIKMDRVNLYALSYVKRVFGLTEEECETLYTQNESYIKESLFEDDIFNNLEEKMEFLVEFSNTLLLRDYTIHFIVKIINNLTPKIAVKIHDNLSKCFKLISESKREVPIAAISKNINEWIRTLPIAEIAQNLEDYKFVLEDEEILDTIKVIMEAFKVDGILEHKQNLMRILGATKKMFTSGYIERHLESKMTYLNDLVEVAMMVVHGDELKGILNEASGIQYCRTFISAVYDHLTRKPYTLLDPALPHAAVLLNDIVKISLRNDDVENVLELVDELWPTYITRSTLSQRHALLLDLSRSTQLPQESNPMQWLLRTLESQDTKTHERILLIEVIPGGEEYNSAYLSITSRLPTRLDEIKGNLSSYFRSILESFARHRSKKLLEIIIKLASSVDTQGWWDDALVVTVYALSVHEDSSTCDELYRRSWDGCALGASQRLLVPLLRFSKASFCEEFFSTALPHLLSILEKKPREASTHYTYQKYIHDSIRAFTILEVLFQKVPRQSIESPKSHLYHKITDKVGDSLYWIVKIACKLGLTLKAAVKCPGGADERLKNSYRMFHCAIYKCVVSALCCRDPSVDVYATVFNGKMWAELIGTEHMHLPVKYQWNRSSAHYTAPPSAQRSGTASLTLHSRTASLTRDFSQTLSENPLQYDLQETQVQAQEVPVGDNPLNKHECGASLIMLFRKVAPHTANRPMQLLAAELAGSELHCNAKWLLAQAICNCKEELKPHASVLRPALLDVTANTASNIFNSVHVDIVDTIILWHDEDELPASCIGNLNSTVQHLISTYLEYRNASVSRSLLEKLDKLLTMYANVLTISGQFFKDRMVDFKSETTKRCIQILKRVTKAKIYIPELLPSLIQAMEGKRVSPDITEVFGLALANTDQNAEAMQRFQSMLDKLRRSDAAEYIKLLYYTQKGYPKCCDEANFRVISDLLPKIVGREKQKCLQIIVEYVSGGSGAHQRSVEALPLHDLLGQEAGLDLLRHSFPHIHDSQRRQLVLQVAKLCNTPTKEKQAAFRVILKVFELIIASEPSEPSSKRRAECSTICNLLKSTDEYVTTVLPLVGEAVASETEDAIRDVEIHLSTDSNVRFCESFALAVYFPIKYGRMANISRALGTVLMLFFSKTRQPAKSKRAAQQVSSTNAGVSWRTPSNLSMMNVPDAQLHDRNAKAFEGKLQDEILDDLLKYALANPSAASVMCVQLIQTLRGTKRPGLDFDDTLYDMLSQTLGNICEVTPYIMEMFLALRYWKPSLKRVVDELCQVTVDSEAEALCRAFKEGFQIHTLGHEHLIMGFATDNDILKSEAAEFSIEDLVSAFDKLSNWDNIPIQQKNKLKSTLPPLWTDAVTFKREIQDFQGCPNIPAWFEKMVDVCKGSDADQLCFRNYDKWPRKMFEVSAAIELLDWEKLRDEEKVRLPEYIHPSECIAKMAARVMIRRAFLDAIGQPSMAAAGVLRLSQHASSSGLHELARACCISLADLSDSDKLKLFELRITSERGLALEKSDTGYLESAHHVLEQLMDTFADTTDLDHILRIRHQTLLVKGDMKSLSKVEVETAITDTIKDVKTCDGKLISKPNTEVLSSICILGVTQFDNLWDVSEASERDDLLRNMCEILSLYLDINLGAKWKFILDIIVCRFDDFKNNTISEETALRFLNQIKNIPDLDEFSKDQIKSNIGAFPSHLHEMLSHLQSGDEMMTKFKRCFQLVADVEHLLRDYCKWLGDALRNNDKTLWSQTFANMKEKVFENPYAGADYQVLYKYKKTLYQMEEFDPNNEEFKRKLSEIEAELKTDKTSLFLSQLCPALCGEWSGAEGECVAGLMGLKGGVRVVKFNKKVSVFSGAVRRPVLLTARLSDGGLRRVIVKSGERVARQAAAVRVLAACERLYPQPRASVPTSFCVTVLSDDCGIIEYLEDTVRLRSLVAAAHPIDDTLLTVKRAKSDELILSPRAALNSYNNICSQIPATILRSAVEASSISIEDFIIKKKNFLESVSVMSIATCILGVGDRHLENLLWCGAGGVCHVDWAALLQFGSAELPPARLSRNILAVCDLPALESRLQQLMSILRDNHQLILASFRIAFKWMGNDFLEKYPYIEGLLRGTMLSYQVTQDIIQRSDRPYREKYVELLEDVFLDYPKKEQYEIVEQISSILRQSTDPRILSVVRTGWEPWI